MSHDTIHKTATITQGAAFVFALSRDSAKLLKEVRRAMRHDELEILWEELEDLDPNTYQGFGVANYQNTHTPPRLVTHIYVNSYIYMDTPTQLHKLTVLSQLLERLRTQTLEAQTRVIKAAGEEDLRLMLLNRYPLRLQAMPDTMAGVIRELEALLPDVKRIIEN